MDFLVSGFPLAGIGPAVPHNIVARPGAGLSSRFPAVGEEACPENPSWTYTHWPNAPFVYTVGSFLVSFLGSLEDFDLAEALDYGLQFSKGTA